MEKKEEEENAGRLGRVEPEVPSGPASPLREQSKKNRNGEVVGPIEGHVGEWVGMDWDTGEAKHDGYRRSQASGSAVRWKTG